jgi:hypothetical protein
VSTCFIKERFCFDYCWCLVGLSITFRDCCANLPLGFAQTFTRVCANCAFARAWKQRMEPSTSVCANLSERLCKPPASHCTKLPPHVALTFYQRFQVIFSKTYLCRHRGFQNWFITSTEHAILICLMVQLFLFCIFRLTTSTKSTTSINYNIFSAHVNICGLIQSIPELVQCKSTHYNITCQHLSLLVAQFKQCQHNQRLPMIFNLCRFSAQQHNMPRVWNILWSAQSMLTYSSYAGYFQRKSTLDGMCHNLWWFSTQLK